MKIFFTSMLLLLALPMQAQHKLRFGLQAGLLANDQYNHATTLYSFNVVGDKITGVRKPALGYLLGGTVQYALTRYFTAGTNVTWYQSSSISEQESVLLSGTNEGFHYVNSERYRFQYIQVPVWFQYTFAGLKGRPSIRTGPAYTYLVGPPALRSTYSDNVDNIEHVYNQQLPYAGGYGGNFPRHEWQLMTEIGISLSNHIRVGIRYDLLAQQRTIIEIGATDGAVFYSFRNRNVGLTTEILF